MTQVVGGQLPDALPEASTGGAAMDTVAAQSCADVLLVGVEGPRARRAPGAAYGPVLQTFAASFERSTSSRSVQLSRIATKGPGAAALAGRPRTVPATRAVSRQRVKAWASNVPASVSALRERLATARTSCPTQQIVLAGHAQGAMAVHRVLATLDASYSTQVVGAALIADGDRSPGTRARLTGAPAAARSGRGVAAAKLRKTVADVPTSALRVPVYSVCTSGDIVCDLRRNPAREAIAVHAGYTGSGARKVRNAGDRLGARTMAWPRPSDVTRSVVPLDSRFAVQLPVDVGPRNASSVVWENVSGLPSGTSLTQSGRLTGTIASRGSWTLSYTLRNTQPSTPAVRGSMVVTAAADPDVMSAGGQTTCEVRPDTTAWCWGDNRYGQLGDGTTVRKRIPVQVGLTTGWSSISTSGSTTCGVKSDQTLWCWGMNNRGQLGIGGTAHQRSPVQVGAGVPWRSVSNGWVNTCAIAADGSAWCWGDNAYGQLGAGDRVTRDRPRRVGSASDWASIVVGGYHVCGVKTSGLGYCWGQGTFGQIGNASTSNRARAKLVAGGHTWQRIYAGWSSTCGLDAYGDAWCWGLNDKGQLGDGTRTSRTTPTAVPSELAWTALAMGDSSVCGLTLDGSPLCWGSNRYGQLGNGSTAGTLRPAAVRSTDTWSSVEAGWFHMCARALDGRRSCWGNNERGQLGVGDTTSRSAPRGTTARYRVPSTLDRRNPSRFTTTTVNVLGSEKTEPGGGAPMYAPGRLRTDWLADYLVSTRSGIVGFQELMPDQLRLLQSMFPSYDFWPGMENGIRGAWTTVMWDSTVWEKLDAEAVMIPFRGKTRPTALVLLRNKVTGKRIWVFNVHNSAQNTAARRAERLEAMKIEVAKINEKRADGTPVLFQGDLNEHRRAFCFITSRTNLRSVTGGSGRPTCRPPSRMRVDWIFASPKFTVRGFRIDNTPTVEGRITDHAVLHGRLSL